MRKAISSCGRLVVVVACVFTRSVVRADIVHLKEGGTLEGKIVRDAPDQITIETRMGVQQIDRTRITSIEKKKTDWEEYRERAALVEPKDAEAHYQLALWCRGKGLAAETMGELRKTIEANPDHAGARKELGFVKTNKGWVKSTEADKAKAAEPKTEGSSDPEDRGPIAGFTKVGNLWLTPEDARLAESGQVRYKGQWMTPEDRDKRKGDPENGKKAMVESNGRWQPVEEADKQHADWSTAWVIETSHYEIHANTSRDFADGIADQLEGAFPEWARLFGGPPKKRMTVYVFETEGEFKDYLAKKKLDRFSEQDGLFDAQSRLVMTYSGREVDFVKKFILGPATFQYYYECWENALPSWLTEAVAFYFRTNTYKKGVFTPGLPNKAILKDFQAAVKADNLIPLAKLMRLDLIDAYDHNIIETFDAESYMLFQYLRGPAPSDVREKFDKWFIRLRTGPFFLGNADLLSADWWRDDIGRDNFAGFEKDFFEWANKEVDAELNEH
ncbi:MAG: hypothetical protein HYR85_15220 [Planctomycetes bacterium]|nr:hypothetical protein [Planctomycetota bacterium]MBI3844555.1 hypothetical protein [Planctomycetota bacterium]